MSGEEPKPESAPKKINGVYTGEERKAILAAREAAKASK